MSRLFASLGLLLCLETVAEADNAPADVSITSFDPDAAVAPVSAVEGPGIKVGEGTVLHPVFGLETGYVSNVFYSSDNPVGAGVLRLLAQIGGGSITGDRSKSAESDANPEDAGAFQYRVSVRASYDAILSGDATARGTGGLGVGATFHGVVNPQGTWTFGIDEDFARIIRAANFETSENVNRDINNFAANLLWHPSDRAFSGYLYYNNTIDVFEQSENIYPDRLQHRIGIHPQWKVFPETQLYIDASVGIYTGLGTTEKESSIPLLAVAGIQTLLTLNTTIAAHAGYANGFYSGGATYSAPVFGGEVGYRYSPFGRVVLGYDYLYADSINANYYHDNVIRALLTQQVKPVTLVIQPEVYFREYEGISTIIPGAPDSRSDTILSLVAGAHYSFRNWIAATLDYRLTDVSTDYRYPVASGEPYNPSYVRHEILLGVRVAL